MNRVPAELFDELEHLSWFPFSDEPIIVSSPIQWSLSNPAVLFPEEAPDDKWHLFAHSILGIHHYTSDSGLSWVHQKLLISGGRCPSLFEEDGTFHLIYEQRGRIIPLLTKKGRMSLDEMQKESHIELISSTDLYIWSRPRHLISGNDIAQASLSSTGLLSHPQVMATDHGYRLYLGVSSVSEDRQVARYMVSAVAPQLLGPYHQERKEALIESSGNEYYRSLGAGQVSVYCNADSCKALETSLFFDENRNAVSSAIIILDSDDGLSFTYQDHQPILVPSEKGWASCQIRTATMKYKWDEKCWYCFFSASSPGKFFGERESIGLLIGKDPHPRRIEDPNDILYRNS